MITVEKDEDNGSKDGILRIFYDDGFDQTFTAIRDDYEVLSKAFEMLMLMLASDSTKVIILNDLIDAIRKQIKKNE